MMASWLALAGGCGSDADEETNFDGGAGGAAGGGAMASAGGAVNAPDGYPAECVENPPLAASSNAKFNVEIAPFLHGKPLVMGEENMMAGGGTLLPTNFRFYVSAFAFKQAGKVTSGTLVDAAGKPLPYGVHLVNASSATSLRFMIAAPAGTYDEMTFLLGLTAACNSKPGSLRSPLDEASQLKWPHTQGFLFLRFEGKFSASVDTRFASKIHMGAAPGNDGFAPHVTIKGPFEIGTGSAPLRVVFSMDEMLIGASTQIDLSGFSPGQPVGEEVLAGERLRRFAESAPLLWALNAQ